jgi:uncharacterized protein (DUF2141 family)
MKKRYYLFLFILGILSAPLVFSQSDNKVSEKTGDLFVIISGLKNNNGDLKIGLFNTSESFDGKEEKFRGAALKVDSSKVEWILRDIPFGEYAIKAFHDEDLDDKVGIKFGIPSEGFGFSNNPSIFSGAPSFEKAKFLFNTDSLTVEIKLISF